MNSKKYFKLRLKKTMHHYPAILAINIILVICIALGCILIINKNATSESKQKLKIGIVGDLTDTYLDIGITAIQNMDTSNLSIEFVNQSSEAEAKTNIKNGRISGYIRIPEGFVDAVMDMDNIPVSYVTNNAPNGFGSILMNEVAKSISDIVTHTQKGIYGMQEFERKYNTEQTMRELTDKLNYIYILSVLNRTNSFEAEYIGIGDGLSMGGYFACGGIMIFLMLWGISCSSLLLKKDRSLEKLLISRGQSVHTQVMSEFLSFFLITFVTFVIFSLLAGIGLQFFKSGIRELDNAFFFDFIFYVVKIIPVLLMVTSLQFLFYELVSGTVGVVLLQFVYAIGTGYICGCLYPSYYFPESVQRIASLLPTGVGVTYMRQTMSSSLSLNVTLGTILYTALFMGLIIVFRNYENARDKI